MSSEGGRPRVTGASDPDDISVDLSSRRTGMSFQRTRMSAERTLMSVIRTSVSLIGFGFTVVQFFQKLREAGAIASGGHATRRFGLSLMLLGVAMLVLGILYHLLFMRELRVRRDEMIADGLIHGQSGFPPSLTLITAVLFLLVGVTASISILYGLGPFG